MAGGNWQSSGGGGAGGAAISAGTNLVSSGTAVFSNSNGITFGANTNGVITASVAGTVAGSPVALSAGTQSNNTGTIAFANSNGITFGMSGSNQITASHNGLTTAAASNHSHAFATTTTNGASIIVGTTNSSGVTIGVPSFLTTGRASTDGLGLNTAGSNVTWTANSSGVSIDARGYAGTGTAVTGAASITLNSGGVSFNGAGLAGTTSGFTGANISATITHNTAGLALSMSVAAGGGGGVTPAVSAANGSYSFSTLSFSNANGVSWSTSAGSALVASVAAQTNQSIGIYAASQSTAQSSSSTVDARSISFAFKGAVSGGMSGGSIVISSPDTTTFNPLSVGISTFGNTAGDTGLFSNQLVLVGSNNITISGSSNGGSATLSIIGGAGGGGGAAISAGTQSVSTGTVVYSNSNNITFGMSGSSRVTASYAFNVSAGTTSNNLTALSFSNGSGVSWGLNAGTMTASVASQTNQTVGLYALGNTTQNSSSTMDARTLSFNALGAMTIGFSNSSIQVSAPATSSLVGVNGISISSNGSTISVSAVPSTGTNGYFPYADLATTIGQVGQASLLFDPQSFPNIAFDRVLVPVSNVNGLASSGSHTLSFWFGLYTRNASTLSLYASVSASTAVTHSGTVGNYSLYSGLRHVSMGMTTTVTEGKYWMAFLSRTTSGGADGSYSNAVNANNLGSYSFAGAFGVAANATQQFTLGQGFYSATTSGMPSSVAFSQINGSASNAPMQQALLFAKSTV